MTGWRRRFSGRFALAALAGSLMAAPVTRPAHAHDTPPSRVVSINLCTDQLAMLMAAEGQLHSVSHLAGDPASSVLATQARRYQVNHGLAEEIVLMRPDLVLAGTFTTRAPVELLRRLGFRVEEFAPATSFDDVRADIARMGELLGRRERAAELIAELDAGLAALAAGASPGLTVALYYANSYTSGRGTLADAVVEAAGLTNLAVTLGLNGTARLSLELLVLAMPDLVAGGDLGYGAPALAQQNFSHPAYAALVGQAREITLVDRYTVCGAPFTLAGARLLQEAAGQRR